MKISLAWLNRSLEPRVSAQEAEEVLTFAGFPFETTEPVPGGDTMLDVEITSNRGDCLSHLGLAREIAACSGRTLKPPHIQEPRRSGNVADALRLDNREPGACPLFTAQVIQGVKVGPSPAWLVSLLEAVGQRSINNVVDVTNWLTFELGQPAHVFDLAKLAGRALVIRFARDGEPLTTLDGKPRRLAATDLVVADAERAQSLAGVIGGQDSEVTEATSDIVLEAATWDPVTIRRAARRLGIRTDAGHRFERGVDPRTVEFAARRAAAMIVELAGGTLLGGPGQGEFAGKPVEGMLSRGRPLEPLARIDMRPSRCALLLGYEPPIAKVLHVFRALGIEAEQASEDLIRCTVPPWRIDLTREIDLIEEVARTLGLDRVPQHERLPIAVAGPQASERAVRELGFLLTGLGFFETVTFSFVSREHAALFLRPGLDLVEVSDDRRAAEPALRPSVLASLLACRRANQDANADVAGGVRLFETAATFAQRSAGRAAETVESRTLGLLIDVPGVGRGKQATFDQKQRAIRELRGGIEALTRAIAGPAAVLSLVAAEPHTPAWDAAAHATIRLDDAPIGSIGLVSQRTLAAFGLDIPVAAAELDLDAVIGRFPPGSRVTPLPEFPGIERDLSVVVGESVAWDRLAALIDGARIDRLERLGFVGTYRGKQVGAGKKSVTLRLAFRDPSRTLRHEEVDPQVAAALDLLKRELGAELRT